MLKIKLLLEKQENLMRERIAEDNRIKEEKEFYDYKKCLINELKTTQNTEVPTDDQINDLTKYNFHKNTTNLQSKGFGQNNSFYPNEEYFNKKNPHLNILNKNLNKDDNSKITINNKNNNKKENELNEKKEINIDSGML